MATQLRRPSLRKQQRQAEKLKARQEQPGQLEGRRRQQQPPQRQQQRRQLQRSASGRRSGTVSRWLNLKGFGWVQPDDGNATVFVHFTAISPLAADKEGQSSLRVGDRVDFDTVPDPNDPKRVVASDVTGVGGGPLQPGYKTGEKVGWREDGPLKEVYVGNLAFRTTWRDLQSHFSQVGSVAWAGVATDGWDEKNNHPFSKGWGSVRFDDADEARRAILELDGSRLHGREIYVKEYVGGQEEEEDDEFAHRLLPWT